MSKFFIQFCYTNDDIVRKYLAFPWNFEVLSSKSGITFNDYTVNIGIIFSDNMDNLLILQIYQKIIIYKYVKNYYFWMKYGLFIIEIWLRIIIAVDTTQYIWISAFFNLPVSCDNFNIVHLMPSIYELYAREIIKLLHGIVYSLLLLLGYSYKI